MAIKTRGINHPALFGLSYEKTIDFYTRLLGMRLVLEQPNLDDPESVHLFFEAGPGQFIAYFVPKPGKALAGQVQRGALNHIALNLGIPLEDEPHAEQAGVEVDRLFVIQPEEGGMVDALNADIHKIPPSQVCFQPF